MIQFALGAAVPALGVTKEFDMSLSLFAPAVVARPDAPAAAARTDRLRMLLVLGAAAAALAAATVGDPGALRLADPALALLLRAMAVIKGAIAVAVFALLWWRLGHPVERAIAVAYLAGAAAMAGAVVLIWQLSFIVPAALGFHAATMALLLAAWRDGGQRRRAGDAPA